MRFVKGNHYPHPGRGPGRGAYYVSEAARRARRNNLSKSRHRSEREGKIIKLLIWQSYFDGGLQQRSLAHLLVSHRPTSARFQKQSAEGLSSLAGAQRVDLDDLESARHFTARLREQEPGLLAHQILPRPPGT
jgi:hypothetical protein